MQRFTWSFLKNSVNYTLIIRESCNFAPENNSNRSNYTKMKQIKNILAAATLLALPMTFTSCEDILGEWSKPVPSQGKFIVYTDKDTKTFVDIPADAIVWTGTVAPGDLAAGTYVVEGNVVCSGDIKLTGETKLILKDGAKLTVNRLSYITGGILNIYGQSDDEATMGQLVCKVLAVDALNIYGGNITVANEDHSVNYTVQSFSGDMTIYAGILRATSGYDAAILVAPEKTLTINGETVIARSLSIYCRAGISAGTVVINGGTVEAYGSDNPNDPTHYKGQGAPGILYATSFDYQGGSLTAICGAPTSATPSSCAIATETGGGDSYYVAGSLHNTSAAAVTVNTSTDRTTWSGTQQNIAAGAIQALNFQGIKIE